MRNIEIEKIRDDTGVDRWGQDDLGRGGDKKTGSFHVLLSIAASLAFAIVAIAAGGRILVLETTSAGAYLATAANVTIALALVILWGLSLGVIFRYIKSLSGKEVQIAISPEHED
jgi:hypothetical protein